MEDFIFSVGTFMTFQTGEQYTVSKDLGHDTFELTEQKTGDKVKFESQEIRRRLGWKTHGKNTTS